MRRLISILLTFLVAIPVVALLSPAPAALAADGLRIESTTTYTVDPESGAVRVQTDLVLTNQVADKVSGNRISRAYYKAFHLGVSSRAANVVVATSSGTPLAYTVQPADSAEYQFLVIDFAKNIFYQQSARLSVTYDLNGDAPRSDSPYRVNPSYASFIAFGVGDPGLVTVRVVVPSAYTVETFGGEATKTLAFGSSVYTAAQIADPDNFNLYVSARNDDALVDEKVTIDGNDYSVRSWPGDAEWSTFVQEQIDDGLPVLEELIDQPWPFDQRFELRETNTPYLYGYAGWFSAVDADIEIGEDLDQETILHELSHAWFNSRLFEERWFSEGFAQEYSNLAIARLGGTGKNPDIPSKSDANGFPLNEWADLSIDDGTDDAEHYGYNTSWYVVRKVVDDIGVEATAKVLQAIDGDQLPYRGDVARQADTTVVNGWMRFLDWAEELGEADDIEQVFTDWVLRPSEVPKLADRSEARTAYQSLEDEGDTWTPPVGIRDDMSTWRFDDATSAIQQATKVLALRDELRAISKRLGVTIPGRFEHDYEAADDDYASVSAALQQQIAAAKAVEAAIAANAAPRDFSTRVGLIGTDVDSPLVEARAALSGDRPDLAVAAADRETRLLADAARVGKARVIWTVGVVVGGLLLTAIVLLAVRRRRRRRAARVAQEVVALPPADEHTIGRPQAEPAAGWPPPPVPVDGASPSSTA